MKEQLVILKGRADGIDVWLDEQAEFSQLGRNLREKVVGARTFFAGADTHITFKGRTLTDEEENQLLDIILAETTLGVSFVEGAGFVAPPVARAEAAVSDTVVHAHHIEQNTAFYRHGLRSGQSIRFPGSVVVMGDVNPGSEIVAHGNVVVLGILKGMVHAGAAGDDGCFVSAFLLQPVQLRIAGVITYIPADETKARAKRKGIKPEWAYIKEGQVFIAPLTN